MQDLSIAAGLAPQVTHVIADMLGDVGGINLQLYAQVEQLARMIDRMKGDIAEMRQGEAGRCDLSSATDELDAVVADTEIAATTIIDAVGVIEGVCGRSSAADAAVLQEAAGRIYEACGFQDLSGQRITKVVKTLRLVETGLAALLLSFGGAMPAPANSQVTGDAALLNGPQLPARAQGQAEIDALFG